MPRHQHDVKTHAVAIEMWMPRHEFKGGALQPLPLARQHGFSRSGKGGPRLHLDHRQNIAPARDNIDFPQRRFITRRHNAIAFQPQGQAAFRLS